MPGIELGLQLDQTTTSHLGTNISETTTQTHTKCQGPKGANRTCYNTHQAKSDSNEQTKYNAPSNTSICQLKQKHGLTCAYHTDSEESMCTWSFVLKRASVFESHMVHTMKKVMVLPPCIVPYWMLVWSAKSSGDSMGTSILCTVRNAARLAVYEEMMIRVNAHLTGKETRESKKYIYEGMNDYKAKQFWPLFYLTIIL